MEVIYSDYLLKTGLALMLVSQTYRREGVQPVIKANTDFRALAASSDILSPPEHREVVWVPDEKPGRDKGPMQCTSCCIALMEPSHWDKTLKNCIYLSFPRKWGNPSHTQCSHHQCVQSMPKRNFLWDGKFCSTSSHSLGLLPQKTYCTKVLWGQDTCEISPDECPSHCLPFILLLSSLFPHCFCWCIDSQNCLGEKRPFDFYFPRPPNTFPAANTRAEHGQALARRAHALRERHFICTD